MANPIRHRSLSELEQLFAAYGERNQLSRKSTFNPSSSGEPMLYMVSKGVVSIYLRQRAGDAFTVHVGFLTPGQIFGKAMLLDGELNNAEIILSPRSNVELRAIPSSLLIRAALQEPKLAEETQAQSRRAVSMVVDKLSGAVFTGLEQRCVQLLQEMSTLPDAISHPAGIQVKISRIEMSNMIRCSRETAGRLLKTLEDKGFCEVRGHRVVVRNSLPKFRAEANRIARVA